MKGRYLGDFEELVLLAVCALADEAYGVSVRQMVYTHTARRPTLGAVHAALYRMEDKGLLTSRLGGATQSRGGRRKRLFQITGSGAAALQTARAARESLWALVPPQALDPR